MATYLSCPHCGKTLQVPDDCGGRTTKCPECQRQFVIPGASLSSIVTAVPAVATPVSAAMSPADLERARAETAQLAADDVELAAQVSLLKRRRDALARRLAILRGCSKGRQTFDETLGRIGGFFIAVALGIALVLVLASLFGPSFGGYLMVAAIGFLLTTAIYIPFAFVPDDAALAVWIERMGKSSAEASALYDQAARDEAALRERLDRAQAELRRITRELDSRLERLRSAAWNAMTGRDFEQFLADVFRENGYEVEATGGRGDQGVDLIVTRNGVRVAVQAKGYVGHPVGNDAVQQAHAGCTFHKCDRAAVVTNGKFTTAARMLAERVGCRLIDGEMMGDLIEGRIAL
jgi:hypothetical protein